MLFSHWLFSIMMWTHTYHYHWHEADKYPYCHKRILQQTENPFEGILPWELQNPKNN